MAKLSTPKAILRQEFQMTHLTCSSPKELFIGLRLQFTLLRRQQLFVFFSVVTVCVCNVIAVVGECHNLTLLQKVSIADHMGSVDERISNHG